MKREKYTMSFTAGALLYRESLTVAELYAEAQDWDLVRQRVLDENLLQMRTLSASKRILREVVSRLRQLSPVETRLLRDGTRAEQNQLLWLAICKRYGFIYDFAVEVVREKFLRLDLDLSYDEYDAFFNAKAEWHPEVENVAESTRKKQRQIVFRMLREAELLTKHNRIIPTLLTPRVIETIELDSPAHLRIFPVSHTDVNRLTQ